MTREIVEAVKEVATAKGIDSEVLMSALEDALLSAYRKTPGAARYARVDLDRETADFRVFELILPAELEEKLLAEVAEEAEQTIDPETGELREPEEPELDPEVLAPYEDQIESHDVTPDDFGRIAAQTAKQVILQRIREAERMMVFDEFQDRVGELITGIIQQSDNRYTLVQLRERVEALLPRSEQVWNERYDHGMRVKAVITDVSAEGKGPSIVVSRRSPELIKQLFELEVPEVADGLVEIVGVAREPGYRSKIAVISHADGVDPVGACVGPRGSRVRMVVSELRGEKIDIIPYNEEPARFVAKALSPARVREVLVDDDDKQATVVVPDDQLSLAIGREGQNARLAAKLTGWRVDIKSETDFSQEDDDRLRGGRGGRRPLRRDPLRRAPLPERLAHGLALLRPAAAPGARPLRHPPGDGARRPRRDRDQRAGQRRLARGRGRRRSSRRPLATAPAEEERRRSRGSPPPRSRAEEADLAEEAAGRGRRMSPSRRAEPEASAADELVRETTTRGLTPPTATLPKRTTLPRGLTPTADAEPAPQESAVSAEDSSE